MPADSRSLADEGVVIPPTRLDDADAARAGGPHAQPASARGRPASAAGGGAGGRGARGGADRALRARQLPRRARGDARLRRAAHALPHRGARGRCSHSERRPGGGRRRPRAASRGARGGRADHARLLRLRGAARRQPQLPAGGDAVGLLLRPARADRPGRAGLRGCLPPADRGRARGHAAERAATGGGGRRQRRDVLAGRRPGAGGLRARARPGHDEQPHARQRRLHLLRDARRRPGRLRRRRRPERRARGDVEHAEHARRGARARVPRARGGVRAAARLGRRRPPAGRRRRGARARGAGRDALLPDHRAAAAPAARGGWWRAGPPGRNLLNGEALPAKASGTLRAGDRLRIETPGGGGYGRH